MYGYQCFFQIHKVFSGEKWEAQNIRPLLDIKNAPLGKNPEDAPISQNSNIFDCFSDFFQGGEWIFSKLSIKYHFGLVLGSLKPNFDVLNRLQSVPCEP